MLRRIGDPKQGQDGTERLWFNSPEMDLLVDLDARGHLRRFQLAWDKGRDEKALDWCAERGFSFGRVLDCEDRPGRHKATPLLVAGEPPERDALLGRFAHEADGLPETLRGEVLARLTELPAHPSDEKP